MFDFLKEMVNSFGKMSGLMTFLFLSFSATIYWQKEAIEQILISRLKKINRNRKSPKSIKKLKYHSMFIISDKVERDVEKLDFTTLQEYDPIKTYMIRQLIRLKVKTVKKTFRSFVERDDLENMAPQELKFSISCMLSILVNEYNEEAYQIMTTYNRIEPEDARFLIDSYEDYRVYIVNAFTYGLDLIVLDDNYDNNFERLNTILYTVGLSLSVIPKDVVSAFNKINGRFKKYEGKVIM